MAKEIKEKYVVVSRGLDNCSVGDVIELSEAQAKARVNKVVKESEYGKVGMSADKAKVEELQGKLASALKDNADLRATIQATAKQDGGK